MFYGVYNPIATSGLPVHFWRGDFATFRLHSIDIFPLYGRSTPIVTHVALTVWNAFTEDTYWFTVEPNRYAPTRIVLGPEFNGVTNVLLQSYDSDGTSRSQYSVQFSNITFGPVTVSPEPTTLALLGGGLLGVGTVARRRRRT